MSGSVNRRRGSASRHWRAALAGTLALLLCGLDWAESCTSFVLDTNGHTVFGTNYDNTIWPGLLVVTKRGIRKSGLSPGLDGRPLRWTSRFASITFCVGGYQLPWAGMNDQGLVLSTMALREASPPAPDQRPPLDYGPLWMQYILDTCATVRDVIASDATVRIVDTVDHYLVADRNGNTAVVELLEGEMVVRTGDDLVVKVLTNSQYPVSTASWQTYRGQGGYSWLPDSERRFCLAADRVAAFEPTTVDAAVNEAFGTLQEVSDGPFTRWSIVFDTGSFRAFFRTFDNPEIRSVDLHHFDPRCQIPDQMLDIHAPLEGDIGDRFFERSYDLCYDHTMQYLVSSGLADSITPESLTTLLDQLFSWSCIGPRRATARVRHDLAGAG